MNHAYSITRTAHGHDMDIKSHELRSEGTSPYDRYFRNAHRKPHCPHIKQGTRMARQLGRGTLACYVQR